MKYNFFKKLAAINMAAIVSLSAVAPTFAADDTNNSNEESSVSTDTSDTVDDFLSPQSGIAIAVIVHGNASFSQHLQSEMSPHIPCAPYTDFISFLLCQCQKFHYMIVHLNSPTGRYCCAVATLLLLSIPKPPQTLQN